MQTQNPNIEILNFYGNFYFGNRSKQNFFSYNIRTNKIKKLSELEFNIIELLSEIKESLLELK